MKKSLVLIIVAIITGLLFGIAVKTKVNYMSPMSIERIESTKNDLYLVKGQIENNEEIIKTLKDELKEYENFGYNRKDNKEKLKKLKDKYMAIAGYKDMEGEGIKITLKDSKDSIMGNTNMGILHDIDLLNVLNDLKKFDAEVLGVNGIRINATTNIKCGGAIIRIDDISKATPYIIEAIGDKEKLYASITNKNSYLSLLKDVYKIEVQVEKLDKITIEKRD